MVELFKPRNPSTPRRKSGNAFRLNRKGHTTSSSRGARPPLTRGVAIQASLARVCLDRVTPLRGVRDDVVLGVPPEFIRLQRQG